MDYLKEALSLWEHLGPYTSPSEIRTLLKMSPNSSGGAAGLRFPKYCLTRKNQRPFP